MLIAAHELAVPMVEVPIRTIYEEGNKSSHFNPIVDSMKIYFVLLRFGSVSVLTGLLDSLVYILVWRRAQNALAAQVIGRLIAMFFNYSMVRSSVFYSKQRHQSVLPKYLALVAASGTASYGGIHLLHERLGVSTIPAKLLVETVLFFVNFAVQRLFIFKPKGRRTAQPRTALVLTFSALAAIAFAVLLGAEIRGFATSQLFRQDIWLPIGLKRFVRYRGSLPGSRGAAAGDGAVDVCGIHECAAGGADCVCDRAAGIAGRGVLPDFANALGTRILGGKKPDTLAVELCATMAGVGRLRFSDDPDGAVAGELRGSLGRGSGDTDPARPARRGTAGEELGSASARPGTAQRVGARGAGAADLPAGGALAGCA